MVPSAFVCLFACLRMFVVLFCLSHLRGGTTSLRIHLASKLRMIGGVSCFVFPPLVGILLFATFFGVFPSLLFCFLFLFHFLFSRSPSFICLSFFFSLSMYLLGCWRAHVCRTCRIHSTKALRGMAWHRLLPLQHCDVRSVLCRSLVTTELASLSLLNRMKNQHGHRVCVCWMSTAIIENSKKTP